MKTHVVTLFIGVFALVGVAFLAIPAESAETSNDKLHVTQYLAFKNIPANDFLHLFDTTPDTIAGGHLAIKTNCDENGDGLVDVLMGMAPDMETVKLDHKDNMIHELSTHGKMCLYHIDLPVEHDLLVTDIALSNPSDHSFRFGPTATVTIYVNAFGEPVEHEEHGE